VIAALAALAIAHAPAANQVRIRIAPGASAGPIVRALDSHFKCLELVPQKDGAYILQNCNPARPTPKGGFRVHAN
jgi:hypothetical protein